MGKEGAHVQHARRRVGRPRARSLARPVTVLGREGGRRTGMERRDRNRMGEGRKE